MYHIGLDVHKKTISYCVKDAAGQIHQEGKIGSTRRELDSWIKTLPQPRMIAMEATIFTGWIYDHLLPHAGKVPSTKSIRPFAKNCSPRHAA
jgi:transposase